MSKTKKELVSVAVTSCIWFKEINCPIRQEMEERKLINNTIKPKDEDENIFAGMMKSMVQTLPMDLSVLPAYCNICHLRKFKLEKKD